MTEATDTLPARRSVITEVAALYGMEAGPFEQTLRATIFPEAGTREQFAAFIMVARTHNLNPITREIFAFPTKHGGIVPVVSVDGWLKIVNSHPNMDGLTFRDSLTEDGKLISVTARMYRKDRREPIEVTEYMSECARNTDTWRQWPARMLRHKATIQAARYAFGFAGIYDIDEAERMRNIPDAGLGPGTWEDIAPEPGDDTSGQFLGGEILDLLNAEFSRQMAACETLEALGKVWKSYQRKYYNATRKRISHLAFSGWEELHARQLERVQELEFAAHQEAVDITAHISAQPARNRTRRIVKRRKPYE